MSIKTRLGLSGKPNVIDMEFDGNESFLLKNCITYLERHLNRFPNLTRETLEIVSWVLGEDMSKMGHFFLEKMNNKQKKMFEEELLDCELDPEEHARTVSLTYRKSDPRTSKAFKKYVMRLLASKASSLKRRKKTEIEKNVRILKKMFDLNDKEADFSVLLFLLSSYSPAEQFFVNHLECNKYPGQKYLANILGLRKSELNEVLSGNLKKVGLFEMDNLDLRLEDDFFKLFQNPYNRDFSEKFFFKISCKSLPIDHHFIENKKVDFILDLLKEKKQTSSHILLYGPPGTGKSSFAYALAEKLGVASFEIVRGEDNTTYNRRASIIACLNMTNTGGGSLIIVDEADNILNTQNSWFVRGETQDKGWLNQLLEEPETRMIWITNRIDGIDDSVLRRFAFSLCFESFNQTQRFKLWENILSDNNCKGFFKKSHIENLAKKYPVNAGVIDLAVKKSLEANPGSKEKILSTIELSLEAHTTLLNSGDNSSNRHIVEKNYTIDGLNINGDPNFMMQQLKQFDQYLTGSDQVDIRNMNLLFFGPPGTGKSELARYAAKKLNKRLLIKNASDFLDPFVGNSERNIKSVFIEAENEEAILLIDEADSLLFNRERAVRSWEISFTNEFLTNMERFRGILICTTNRLRDMDDASLRRFNIKMSFDYLSGEGNIIFYKKFFSKLIAVPLDEINEKKLRRIDGLSPGDFKTIRDRFFFYPPQELHHNILVQALNEEVHLKNIHKLKTRIGF